ncbi:hypothetical protein BEWA_035590 [Theileria equi strain WA]|uniref:Signal peptide-containing protein n=1 Tax=Theileria equi strain WA TaxID=1537102 RepID=L1LEC3_THEEQ|nr:hypothetical protein BEWA_035590 [Theileria equi strain WA]EKX73523.1 hypothetical protein BEWA_035590 [Theileria equi strain WA]|eukprot:XP_004832975.1 hypothetical protein BEWA_035590 [Theileria equi strain WA]
MRVILLFSWLYILGISHCILPFGDSTLTLDLSRFNSLRSQPNRGGVQTDDGVVQGIPYKSFFLNNGKSFGELTEGRVTIWEAGQDEKCTAVNLYYKESVELLSIYVRGSHGSRLVCFEKVGRTWKSISENKLEARLEELRTLPICMGSPDRPNPVLFDLNDVIVTGYHQTPREYGHLEETVEQGQKSEGAEVEEDEDSDDEESEDLTRRLENHLSTTVRNLLQGKGTRQHHNTTLDIRKAHGSNFWVAEAPINVTMYRGFFPEDDSIKKIIDGETVLWSASVRDSFQNACTFSTHHLILLKVNAKREGITTPHCLEFKEGTWRMIEYKKYSDKLAHILTRGEKNIEIDMERVPEDLGNVLDYVSDGYRTISIFPFKQFKIRGVHYNYTSIWSSMGEEFCSSATIYTDENVSLSRVTVDDGQEKRDHYYLFSTYEGNVVNPKWKEITFDDLAEYLKDFKDSPENLKSFEAELNIDKADEDTARTRMHVIDGVVTIKREPLPANRIVRVVDSDGPIWEARENQRCLSSESYYKRDHLTILILLIQTDQALELKYHEKIGDTWGVLRDNDIEEKINSLYAH